ncbi:glycerophosphodiester phosphodiesterase family protein [Nonlabens antarcticus]|uniref:glycerophosphodiester phosphodiesterase family protein n=1 Tax=Nonlabens antarcticus TaxID=392714 RepID=UPI001890B784|nr:glycerophosphodiester phosphodiesterase family protein [Nonlabens antarcticus]
MKYPEFFLQGHRGTRGLMPENTIPGMLKAIQDGANVLEMDLQFTADGVVIVAHDPFVNRTYSLDKTGADIPKSQARKHIFYRMNYSDVRLYDVGSKGNLKYLQQQKANAYIPELGELIAAVEKYVSDNKLQPVLYNVEIKAGPEGDLKLHPAPIHLIARVVSILKSANIENRYYIQSFDPRQIQEVKKTCPEIPVAFLTADNNKSVEQHLEPIGFEPEIFSPYFKIVTLEMVKESKDRGIKIIPWTVNQVKTMKSLMKMGVDGIITDYPGVLCQLRNES